MSVHTFSFYSSDLVAGDTQVSLVDDEHRHLARVLRMGTGERIRVTNGRGLMVTAEITDVADRSTAARVVQVEANLPEPVPLVVALAMLPRERMDLALTQCIEAGITGWWPVVAERCHVRRTNDRGDRWNRIAVAALKQSGRAWLPSIEAPVDARELTGEFEAFKHVVLADMGGAQPPDTSATAPVLAIVGPEGGFTDEEMSRFTAAGAQAVHISAQRLRSETAAIALVALLARNRGPV